MADLALALFVLYLALAVGARALLHKLRTGSSGFRGIGGHPGSIGWFGQVLFVEEPYLLRNHGEGYAKYASRVGRFVPAWEG